MQRNLVNALAALGGTLLLVACTAPTDTPSAMPTVGVRAAPAETTVGDEPAEITVYTALEDDQLQRYVPLFEQAHPEIKLNIVRDSTGIITAKFLAEKDNPQADAIWGLAASSLLVADKAGLLAPYAPAGLDRVNPRFRDSATPPKWVGIDVWESALCVNEQEMAAKGLPMPTSWADLTKPVYQGQLVMPDPAASGTGYMSVSSWLQNMGEAEGWAYMEALHQNIAQYVPSGSKPCKMAGAGEFPIGISFGYRALMQKANGEPIVAVWPSEGSGWDVEANALVQKADMQPAARVFLDWALTDDVMREYAKSYPITSVQTDEPVPDGYLPDPDAQLAKNDLMMAADRRDEILAEWQRRFGAKVIKE